MQLALAESYILLFDLYTNSKYEFLYCMYLFRGLIFLLQRHNSMTGNDTP